MEQVVMVHTTAFVTMAVHSTEPINEDEVLEGLTKAMNQDAAQFVVCSRSGPPDELPSWIGTVHRFNVSHERTRTVYIDLENGTSE